MVIGNGMIAKRFADYIEDDRFAVFASGVSNSGNKQAEPFQREQLLLEQTIDLHPEKKLVYFSTCSIYDLSMQSSAYVQHKLAMEELIKNTCNNFCIFRVSNPVGHTNNPNTVLNFFIRHIATKEPFDVWANAGRNLIDLDDMYVLCHQMLSHHLYQESTINIANPNNYRVTDIIRTIENHLNVKGNYKLLDKGSSPQIDVSNLKPLIDALGLHFDEGYLQKLLNKYYPAA